MKELVPAEQLIQEVIKGDIKTNRDHAQISGASETFTKRMVWTG